MQLDDKVIFSTAVSETAVLNESLVALLLALKSPFRRCSDIPSNATASVPVPSSSVPESQFYLKHHQRQYLFPQFVKQEQQVDHQRLQYVSASPLL